MRRRSDDFSKREAALLDRVEKSAGEAAKFKERSRRLAHDLRVLQRKRSSVSVDITSG
jgi:hypothetical protein